MRHMIVFLSLLTFLPSCSHYTESTSQNSFGFLEQSISSDVVEHSQLKMYKTEDITIAIRTNPLRNIHIQMPHIFHDRFTGEIGKLLCIEGDFASCTYNNEHRNIKDLSHLWYLSPKKNPQAQNDCPGSEIVYKTPLCLPIE